MEDVNVQAIGRKGQSASESELQGITHMGDSTLLDKGIQENYFGIWLQKGYWGNNGSYILELITGLEEYDGGIEVWRNYVYLGGKKGKSSSNILAKANIPNNNLFESHFDVPAIITNRLHEDYVNSS